MHTNLLAKRDDLIAELYRRQGEWPEIAKSAEVSYSWLCKFAQRRIKNPGIESLAQLDSVLNLQPARRATDFHDPTRQPQTIGVRPPIPSALIAPTE